MSRFAFLFALISFFAAASAAADGVAAGRLPRSLDSATFLDATYLIELTQSTALSARARSLGTGGYETAMGRPVSFGPWYSSHWTDTRMVWMTQVSPNLGILHGFSTGERGEKYTIAPSLRLGLVMQAATGRNAFLSLRAVTALGGELREKPCTADYGDIGGIQTVNCRLAASLLPPAQTLDYLVREKPADRHQVNLMFTWQF
jgi:hypothetical protein